MKNTTELTAAATEIIVAFHIGRGGRFHNSGFKSYLGQNEISKYTDDLYSHFENESSFKKRYGYDSCDDGKCILDLITDCEFDELEEKFGITEEMLGEEIYFDGGGNSVGLTEKEYQSGVGKINIDHDYNTTYTCKLSDCDTNELKLIRENENEFEYLNEDCQMYIKWMLDEEIEETQD